VIIYVNQVNMVYMRKLIEKIKVNREQKEKLNKIIIFEEVLPLWR